MVEDRKTLGIPTAGYKARTAEYRTGEQKKISMRRAEHLLCRMKAEYWSGRLQNVCEEDCRTLHRRTGKNCLKGLENIGQDAVN